MGKNYLPNQTPTGFLELKEIDFLLHWKFDGNVYLRRSEVLLGHWDRGIIRRCLKAYNYSNHNNLNTFQLPRESKPCLVNTWIWIFHPFGTDPEKHAAELKLAIGLVAFLSAFYLLCLSTFHTIILDQQSSTIFLQSIKSIGDIIKISLVLSHH